MKNARVKEETRNVRERERERNKKRKQIYRRCYIERNIDSSMNKCYKKHLFIIWRMYIWERERDKLSNNQHQRKQHSMWENIPNSFSFLLLLFVNEEFWIQIWREFCTRERQDPKNQIKFYAVTICFLESFMRIPSENWFIGWAFYCCWTRELARERERDPGLQTDQL